MSNINMLDAIIINLANGIYNLKKYYVPSDHAEQAIGYLERGLEMVQRERKAEKEEEVSKRADEKTAP